MDEIVLPVIWLIFAVIVIACQIPTAYVIGYRRGFKRGGDERHRLLNQIRRDTLR